MSETRFYFTARLAQAKQTLCPLGIPAHTAVAPSAETFEFAIDLKQSPAEWLQVAIYNQADLLYHSRLPDSFCEPGCHIWRWDGFDRQGVFDSRRLKGGAIRAEFSGGFQGMTRTGQLPLSFSAARQDWLDVVIDRHSHTINVDIRAQLSNGGQLGVNETPPESACASPAFQSLPADHPARSASRCERPNGELQRLAAAGVARYWSGAITTPDGQHYQLGSRLTPSGSQAMASVKLVYNTNRRWLRSSNPGRIRCLYSLAGNLVPRRIAYNTGWIEYKNGWYLQTGAAADLAFQEAAAHELGHEILSAYGGGRYSYSHKGTSTLLTQSTKSPARGGLEYPQTGPIDLMKYYQGPRPKDFYQRVQASECDLKSLLWLAALKVQ